MPRKRKTVHFAGHTYDITDGTYREARTRVGGNTEDYGSDPLFDNAGNPTGYVRMVPSGRIVPAGEASKLLKVNPRQKRNFGGTGGLGQGGFMGSDTVAAMRGSTHGSMLGMSGYRVGGAGREEDYFAREQERALARLRAQRRNPGAKRKKKNPAKSSKGRKAGTTPSNLLAFAKSRGLTPEQAVNRAIRARYPIVDLRVLPAYNAGKTYGKALNALEARAMAQHSPGMLVVFLPASRESR